MTKAQLISVYGLLISKRPGRHFDTEGLRRVHLTSNEANALLFMALIATMILLISSTSIIPTWLHRLGSVVYIVLVGAFYTLVMPTIGCLIYYVHGIFRKPR